jgi:glycosyltransferase involved in cell wall biosynthesis
VTLVATLLDEAGTLSEWWTSIIGQSRLPDEMVLVDGGSSDGTVEQLGSLAAAAPFEVRIEINEGCNIAQGRNLAISMASHEVIAVTDAGCVLSPHWLRNIVAPLEGDPGTDLVAGFYQPLTDGYFEEVSACATLPLPWEVSQGRFMPSSRSLAFRRSLWRAVGGYPEWLEIGEDMYFNHMWKKKGITPVLVKEALVYWRMRSGLRQLLRQYFLYARGDGESGMYAGRHLLRFGTYAWLAYSAVNWREWRLWIPTTLAASLYSGRRWARIPAYLEGRPAVEQAAAVPCISLLMLSIDAAKMAGYLAGLARRTAA